MNNKKNTEMGISTLKMCIFVFTNNVGYVHIKPLVHNFLNSAVAKKVTLSISTHIIGTGLPQTSHSSVQAVKNLPVTNDFDTLSTVTTTTIIKLVTEQRVEQKNSSLTIKLKTIYN